MRFEPGSIPDEALVALRPAFKWAHTETAEYWIEQCKRDLAQLWFHDDYWLVTRVVDGLRGRIINLGVSAGKYNDALIEEAKAWGRSNGCKYAVAEVRPGIVKRRKGCRVKRVYIEEDI